MLEVNRKRVVFDHLEIHVSVEILRDLGKVKKCWGICTDKKQSFANLHGWLWLNVPRVVLLDVFVALSSCLISS